MLNLTTQAKALTFIKDVKLKDNSTVSLSMAPDLVWVSQFRDLKEKNNSSGGNEDFTMFCQHNSLSKNSRMIDSDSFMDLASDPDVQRQLGVSMHLAKRLSCKDSLIIDTTNE